MSVKFWKFTQGGVFVQIKSFFRLWKDNLIPHIFLVGQNLRKVDLLCLNEAQSSEINIAMAFLTYPIWFAISPCIKYCLLSSSPTLIVIITDLKNNINGFKIIKMDY
jgi:hypothetical protein